MFLLLTVRKPFFFLLIENTLNRAESRFFIFFPIENCLNYSIYNYNLSGK